MMQGYLLSILYLSIGAAYLLADEYGARMPVLLSLRYHFRTQRWVRLALIISGTLLTLLLVFFPIAPGPVLLGDLLPCLNILFLTLYYLHQSLSGKGDRAEQPDSVIQATGEYVESNRRYVGYVTVVVALLHFLLPQLIIL